MTKQNKKSPLARLWHGVMGELSLHAVDFWQLALIPLAGALLIALVLGCVFFFADDPDAPEIVGVILTVAPIIIAAFAGLLTAGTLFGIYYKLGVQMGQTRRAMILRVGLLALAEHAAVLAFAAGCSGLVNLGYNRFFTETESLIAMIPWWGWVLMLTLPLAVGTFGGAVILRFGRKGFWVLYAIFMSVLLVPQFFTDFFVNLGLDAFLEGIGQLTLAQPHLVCLVSVLPFLLGVALLWRLPIKG